LKEKDRDLLVTKEYNYIYEISSGVDISFMAMLAIFLNRYRIYLSNRTSLYSSKEIEPHRSSNSSRTLSSNGSVRSRGSSKSSKLSLKDVKISNISTHSNSDIENRISFPRDADNRSSYTKRISSLEF